MIKDYGPEIRDLITRLAQARFHARENGPRDSNDHVEASMFASMLKAFDEWSQETAKAQEPASPTEQSVPQGQPLPSVPTVSEDIPVASSAAVTAQLPDNDFIPHRKDSYDHTG